MDDRHPEVSLPSPITSEIAFRRRPTSTASPAARPDSVAFSGYRDAQGQGSALDATERVEIVSRPLAVCSICRGLQQVGAAHPMLADPLVRGVLAEGQQHERTIVARCYKARNRARFPPNHSYFELYRGADLRISLSGHPALLESVSQPPHHFLDLEMPERASASILAW